MFQCLAPKHVGQPHCAVRQFIPNANNDWWETRRKTVAKTSSLPMKSNTECRSPQNGRDGGGDSRQQRRHLANDRDGRWRSWAATTSAVLRRRSSTDRRRIVLAVIGGVVLRISSISGRIQSIVVVMLTTHVGISFRRRIGIRFFLLRVRWRLDRFFVYFVGPPIGRIAVFDRFFVGTSAAGIIRAVWEDGGQGGPQFGAVDGGGVVTRRRWRRGRRPVKGAVGAVTKTKIERVMQSVENQTGHDTWRLGAAAARQHRTVAHVQLLQLAVKRTPQHHVNELQTVWFVIVCSRHTAKLNTDIVAKNSSIASLRRVTANLVSSIIKKKTLGFRF